jgi:O-antigen ligase
VFRTIVAWTTFSALVGIGQYLSGAPEASGLVGSRNSLALYIDIALVCAYLLHLSARRPAERLILAISIGVMFMALALTFSRAGLIVLGIGMIMVFARAARQRRYLVLMVSSLLIALIALFLPDAFWNRAGTIVPSIQRQEDTFGLRVRLWKAGARMVADNPIRGVGPGNFVTALPRYGQAGDMTKRLRAHNSYVSVAAEMGLVGLALFLLIHFLALKRIHRASVEAAKSANDQLSLQALTLKTCIVIIMIFGLSGHLEYLKYLWVFFGLSIAITSLPELQPRSSALLHRDLSDHPHHPALPAANRNQYHADQIASTNEGT